MDIPGTDTAGRRPRATPIRREFSHDNKFVLAADEDFDAVPRLLGAGRHRAATSSSASSRCGDARTPARRSPTDRADRRRHAASSATACDRGRRSRRATPGVNVAVVERGGCDFQVKMRERRVARLRRRDHLQRHDAAPRPAKTLLNMDFPSYTGDALSVLRPARGRLRGSSARWTPRRRAARRPTPAGGADRGRPGQHRRRLRRLGLHAPLRQRRATTSTAVDHFAIEEAHGRALRLRLRRPDACTSSPPTRPRTSPTAPTTRAACGCCRSAPDGLDEVGKFIDEGGNNFWGVEIFDDAAGGRLIAASDRDFGLYLFRYTGPGAAVRARVRRRERGDQRRERRSTIPLTCSGRQRQPAHARGRLAAGQRHGRRVDRQRPSATRRTRASSGRTRSRTRPTTAR